MLIARNTKHIYFYLGHYEYPPVVHWCPYIAAPTNWTRHLNPSSAMRYGHPKDAWVYNASGCSLVRLPVEFVPRIIEQLDTMAEYELRPTLEEGRIPTDWFNPTTVNRYMLWCLYELREILTATDFSKVRSDGWSYCSNGYKSFQRDQMIALCRNAEQVIAAAELLEAGSTAVREAWNSAITLLYSALDPKRQALAMHFVTTEEVLL